MAETGRCSDCLGLLDLLEQLPRDVLRENVWLYLGTELEAGSRHDSERPSTTLGRALRLSCQRSLKLTDELTQRLHLELPTEDDAASMPTVHAARKPSPGAASALILRQEGLVELGICGGEACFIETLQTIGGRGQRLQHLVLKHPACCTAAAGQAVQHRCPSLQTLELKGTWLDPAFFVPLRDLGNLTMVTFAGFSQGSWDASCDDMMSVVATLPHLTDLAFDHFCGTSEPSVVACLAALTHLEDLRLAGVNVYMAEADGPMLGRALGSLTRLTALVLPMWQTKGRDGPHHLCETIDTVVAHLGGLHRLASLADVSDAASWVTVIHGCAALCQLSALAKLCCPGMLPQTALGAGHLPLLRHLDFTGAMDFRLLGATLRPLWPLPELQEVRFSVDLALNLGDTEAGLELSVGQATEDMWQAATLLRQAPQLRHVELTLGVFQRPPLPPLLGLATAILLPLRDVLTELTLQNLPAGTLEVLWPLLCLAGRLEWLSVCSCEVTESGLVSVGRHLTALRHVTFYSSRDARAVDSGLALALAEVRVQPLRVCWYPSLGPELAQLFQAAVQVGGAVLVDEHPQRA